MKIKSQKDFFSGLMFTVVGLGFALGSLSYSVGTGARMGPGYFPLWLGIVMTAMGLFIVFESLVVDTPDGEPIGKFAWKPLFFIIAANLVFGVLLGGLPSIGLPPMGLILAIYALVVISSMAGEHFKLVPTLILATILAAGSYVAFIWALKLQMPVWPTFIAG